jgi:hypothetical protein
LANKQPTLSGSSVVAVSSLTATNTVLSDTIRARAAVALTCDDDLVVTGSLTAQGVNVVQRFTDTRLHPDVVRFAPNLQGYSQILSSLDVSGELSVSSTIYSQNQPVALRSQTEPLFTAVDPLYKNLNLQTGAYELKVRSPFWIHGVFDGTTLNKTVDKGRVPFTVSRSATGVFNIESLTPHPDGADYTVTLTAESGVAFVRGREFAAITSTSFEIVVRDTASFATVNRWVHVCVLV